MAERVMEQPVTRREFSEALDAFAKTLEKIGLRLDRIESQRQWSWPVMIPAIGLLGTAIGFGMMNFAELRGTVSRVAETNTAIEDFRSRIRANEANLRALAIEEETQHRWLADVGNLQDDWHDRMLRMALPNLPPPGYIPFGEIGKAGALNGSGK